MLNRNVVFYHTDSRTSIQQCFSLTGLGRCGLFLCAKDNP